MAERSEGKRCQPSESGHILSDSKHLQCILFLDSCLLNPSFTECPPSSETLVSFIDLGFVASLPNVGS